MTKSKTSNPKSSPLKKAYQAMSAFDDDDDDDDDYVNE